MLGRIDEYWRKFNSIRSWPGLEDIKASEGWLQKCKWSYGIRVKRISGEAFDVSAKTVESLLEQIRELCKGYEMKYIYNIDESGFQQKNWPKKGRKEKLTEEKSRSSEWP